MEAVKVAVQSGDLEAIAQWLSEADEEEDRIEQAVGHEGFSLLHWACAYDQPEVGSYTSMS